MGCCFSTPTTHKGQNQSKNNHHKNNHHHHHHEPPPLPPFEEESVKEVLSETPISKPHQVPILKPETKTHLPLLQDPSRNFETVVHMSEVSEVVSSETPFFKPHQVPILTPESHTHLPQLQNPPQNFESKVPIEETSEVISHLSETCSMTESFSAATTATTATTATATATTTTVTREEDEATSKHNINHKWDRSPSRKRPHVADGNLAGARERRLKSPARNPEPSPEKKIRNGSRPLRGRESGPAANRRRNAGPAALRRDSGEGSGRRSRSPACARTGKVAAGGGRKEVVTPANEVEKEKERKSENEEVVGAQNDVVLPEECLENPHVSMECFIFL